MGGKVALGKTQIFGLVAVILVVCLSFGAFFALQPNTRTSAETQNPTPTPQATATPTTNPTTNPQDQTANTPAPTQQSSGLTEQEALAVAMPCINHYAAENNRTVTHISKEFFSQSSCGPAWFISAYFAEVDAGYSSGANTHSIDPRHWIIGYQVVVSYDGSIVEQQELGIL